MTTQIYIKSNNIKRTQQVVFIYSDCSPIIYMYSDKSSSVPGVLVLSPTMYMYCDTTHNVHRLQASPPTIYMYSDIAHLFTGCWFTVEDGLRCLVVLGCHGNSEWRHALFVSDGEVETRVRHEEGDDDGMLVHDSVVDRGFTLSVLQQKIRINGTCFQRSALHVGFWHKNNIYLVATTPTERYTFSNLPGTTITITTM